MTHDNRGEGKRDTKTRTAAEWFVELDAGRVGAGEEAAFAAWLGDSASHERELERCEAAVGLAQELESDPDVRWMFDEASDLASTPMHNARRTLAWYRRPALAWGIAASAIVVAVVAVASREPSPARMVAMTPNEPLPPQVVIEIASTDPVVVLPGEIVVDARSVAVLPFVDIGDTFERTGQGAATSTIATQLYDDVVRQLATIPGVYVVGRPSVAPYENRDIRPEEVAAQLGVRGIVEARVAEENGRVRVLLQVIDVAGNGFWSEDAFERPVAEMTAMQTDIVSNIAAALASPAGPAEPVEPVELTTQN